jgi:C4-dicarboxylate-specific signal transduction histidine kinase
MGQAKGKCIPEYLARLTDCISEDRDEMRDEVRSLRGHINHIAEIVGMQQDHAKAGRLEENVQIADLVTDAININRAAMVRHAIEVESQVSDDLPVCLLDKHRVLQILVNLVRNAKHAVESKLPHERKITIRARVDNEQLFIVVDDNGMGISPENLTRIFGHGFTTKKQGHGFGLHSSANAAKELGGELSASSQGIGAGASFELRLPVRTAVEDTLPNECAV